MLTNPFHYKFISNPKFNNINLNLFLQHVSLLLQLAHHFISHNVSQPNLKVKSILFFLLLDFQEFIQFTIIFYFCYYNIITRLLVSITSFILVLCFILASLTILFNTSTSIFFNTITISIHTVSKCSMVIT